MSDHRVLPSDFRERERVILPDADSAEFHHHPQIENESALQNEQSAHILINQQNMDSWSHALAIFESLSFPLDMVAVELIEYPVAVCDRVLHAVAMWYEFHVIVVCRWRCLLLIAVHERHVHGLTVIHFL